MKKIHWINCAKFIAILAVLMDHTYNILYTNKDYRILSYFSVSLFILLSGQTAYLSICKHPMGWFKTFVNMSKKLVLAYSISVFIYMIVRHHFFAAETYLNYLIHFNVVGAHYFVFLYLQLAVIAKALWNCINFVRGKKWEILWEGFILAGIIFVSYLTTNYTDMFSIYGGGGKLLGGTYLILFYLGMLLQRYYHCWAGHTSIIKSAIVSTVSICALIMWGKFECMNRFRIDRLIPFGAGINPPSISLITMAVIVMFVAYGVFTLLEQCKFTRWLTVFVSRMGEYTMYIFLYHMLLIQYVFENITIENCCIRIITCWGGVIIGSIAIAVLLKLIKKGCYQIAHSNHHEMIEDNPKSI